MSNGSTFLIENRIILPKHLSRKNKEITEINNVFLYFGKVRNKSCRQNQKE